MSRHGLLLVDKPSGMTSHDVVAKIRRALGTRSVGHSGTLDPLASGLMVVLVGEATKLSDYLRSADKGYRVKVRLGVETDTLDCMGEVLKQTEVTLDTELIQSEALKLSGSLKLKVPIFSAVKVKGKKLYEYARQEQAVDVPVRTMEFFELKTESVGRDFVEMDLKCTKGGYIRAWADELGRKLGVGGIVEELRRTWSAPYAVGQALSLADIEQKAASSQELGPAFIPMVQALPHWRALTISGKDERLMSNGQISHDLGRRLIVEQKTANRTESVVPIKVLSGSRGELLSLVEAQPFKGLKIKRIFNFNDKSRP